MPSADNSFKGISVPAAAWERIFGCPCDQPGCDVTRVSARALREAQLDYLVVSPATKRAVEAHEALRASYEEHLHVIGPDSHSPFYKRLLGRHERDETLYDRLGNAS